MLDGTWLGVSCPFPLYVATPESEPTLSRWQQIVEYLKALYR